MAQETNHSDYIDRFLALLADENLAQVDFDRLRERLREIAGALEQADAQTEQLRLLKEDYIRRTAGMLKAIAAVRRNGDETRQELEFIEQLPSLDATALLEAYRKVSARFRDAFPTSFGYAPSRTSPNRVKRAEEFK